MSEKEKDWIKTIIPKLRTLEESFPFPLEQYYAYLDVIYNNKYNKYFKENFKRRQ